MTAHAREQVLPCDVNEKNSAAVVTVAVVTAAAVATTVGRWRPWEPFATWQQRSTPLHLQHPLWY